MVHRSGHAVNCLVSELSAWRNLSKVKGRCSLKTLRQEGLAGEGRKRGLGDGECEEEGGSLPFRTLDPDSSAMSLNDFLADHQSQAGPL